MRWFPDRRFVSLPMATTRPTNSPSWDPGSQAIDHYQQVLPQCQPVRAAATVLGKRPPSAPQEGGQAARSGEVVRDTPKRQRLGVTWYGGGRRQVDIVVGTGCWYHGGRPLVPVRWVFVHDRTGTHREEYFFTTDPAMPAKAVIEAYTGRWNIETTFQEVRSYLHMETTRGWSRTQCCEWPMPVRSLHGGGVPVRGVAQAVRRGAGGELAGQARCDVLRRDHGGPTLVVAGMGIRDPRSSRGLLKTQCPIPADPAQRLGPAGLRRVCGPLAEAKAFPIGRHGTSSRFPCADASGVSRIGKSRAVTSQ